MKIRTRLTLLFTLLTASILFVFALIIFYSSAENRENEFYRLLQDEAITKANLYFEAKVEENILQDIYRSNREVINEVEVAIYTKDFELLYHDALDIDFVQETEEMIDNILHYGSIQFYQEKWQVIGLKYIFENETYVITAAAYDQYGYNKLAGLRENLMLLFTISIFVIYITGLIFSKRAFKPIKKMAQDAKNISASNLNYRLDVVNNNDEVFELSSTFNEMLNRLENSFNAQKQFVSNISHELRTPLSAIIAELELALSKERSKEEYVSTIQNVLSDSQKIVKLTNSILDFAKASYDAAEIQFKPLRLDEIILDASSEVKKVNPACQIELQFDDNFDMLQSENALILNGNEYLLKIAFANLIENGCKFSENNQSKVHISVAENILKINFSDSGIGIPAEDQEHIFNPFFRGKNKTFADGNGIGLSLVKKIIQLHKGAITITSTVGKGSTFTVSFHKF